jgi:hypothetical protein
MLDPFAELDLKHQMRLHRQVNGSVVIIGTRCHDSAHDRHARDSGLSLCLDLHGVVRSVEAASASDLNDTVRSAATEQSISAMVRAAGFRSMTRIEPAFPSPQGARGFLLLNDPTIGELGVALA